MMRTEPRAMPPRLVYLSSQFPSPLEPRRGVFSLQRVRALQAQGCQVRVISLVGMTPPAALLRRPGRLARWWAERWRMPSATEIDGVPVEYAKLLWPPLGSAGWRAGDVLYAQMRAQTARLKNSFRPDAILSSWLPDAIAACRIGRRLGVPVLAVADGSDINLWPEKYPAWDYARRTLNHNLAALIFVSAALHRTGLAKGLGARKMVTLHNAVDLERFQPPAAGQKPAGAAYTILSVGRLQPEKGFHLLLEALARLQPQLPRPVRWVAVGDGPQRQALAQQAAALGLSGAVDWVGELPQEALPDYYRRADVFCLPSFSEGLPCVVVEALACGTPVVATTVGGVPEVVDGENGLLVPPGDAAALCAALLEAHSRAWDLAAIRRRIVGEFDLRAWANTILSLAAEAAGAPTRPV